MSERCPAVKRLHPFTIAPDGSHRDALRAYIAAAITYKEARGLRVTFVYALLAIGFFLWFASKWPDLLPEGVARLAWLSWLVGAAGGLVAAGAEWATYRKLLRCLSLLGQPFADGAKPPDGMQRSL
jgi:hypothetical protein